MMKNKNQIIADRLDSMELSEKARKVIDETDINLFGELFGELETPEEVEEFIEELTKEDE